LLRGALGEEEKFFKPCGPMGKDMRGRGDEGDGSKNRRRLGQ